MARRARRRRSKAGVGRRRVTRLAALVVMVCSALGAGYLAWLDHTLVERFEARHSAAPTRVYSRPLEWFPGAALGVDEAVRVLRSLGYRRDAGALKPGFFTVAGDAVVLFRRAFVHSRTTAQAMRVRIRFSGPTLRSIERSGDGRALAALALDPVVIGTIESRGREDRKPLRLHEVPDLLLRAILLVEDRNFDSHSGIDPWAVLRALYANLRSGRLAQGGSTITQQLVKNLFLSPERTLARKLREALYALLIELRFEKHEILEAYVNEVFFAQAGNRAIHGFALASEFFFGRPLARLEIQDFALLAGMVKAPSRYDPRRRPERARARRAVVLGLLAEHGLVGKDELPRLAAAPLGVTHGGISGRPYAAFLDLVRRQFEERRSGRAFAAARTRVWSTLDPAVQRIVEESLAGGLAALEKSRGLAAGALQGAVVVLRAESGHVLAMAGDRRAAYAGFNRALDARRPVGSLLKPVIALAAFRSGPQYQLATLLDDSPLRWVAPDGRVWAPRNHDGENHGWAPMVDAVSRSYNVAAARLGLEVGVARFVHALETLGLRPLPDPLPSALLGAVDMSPFAVARLYLPFASGGLGFPPRSFENATDERRRVVVDFPSRSRRVIEPDVHYLVNFLLQDAVSRGTASAALGEFGRKFALAGKTGTTDGYRDGWFAGYSANFLAVVWVGRDDNGPTGLSGAGGALRIWREIMSKLPLRRVEFRAPGNVAWRPVDARRGVLSESRCEGVRELPFIEGAAPPRRRGCDGGPVVDRRRAGSRAGASGVGEWLGRVFGLSSEPEHAR